jgi:membrane protein
MAGAISFNALLAIVPLLVFAVGVAGLVLSARFGDPTAVVVGFLQQVVPGIEGDVDLAAQVQREIARLLRQSGDLTLLGAAILIWLSARLVESLRVSLREIFDISQNRGIIGGKLFDFQVVLVGGLLFMANFLLGAWGTSARDVGLTALGLGESTVSVVEQITSHALAFVAIWVLFLGVYRYLPARRIPWKASLIAATFTALLHELLKWGFGWYVTEVANYRTAYGNLITLAVLFFWVYYEALAFLLGGEVGQVWTMRRARRVQFLEIHGGGEREG